MRLLGSSSRVAYWVAAPAAALVAPAPAFAVDYVTVDEAQALAFPEAERFELATLSLEPAERSALASRLGVAVRARWEVRLARRANALLGTLVVDDVTGKFERITFAVAVGVDGVVRRVEILSYRESHGQEVRLPAWRGQFVGKTAAAKLEVGADMSNISGATLSCRHMTAGVRRIVTVLEALRRQGALR